MSEPPYTQDCLDRPAQGSIFAAFLVVRESLFATSGDHEIVSLQYPYVVVLSQECDLEQDHTARNNMKKENSNHDKFLPSVLMCPAYLQMDFRNGTHLSDLKFQMEGQSPKVFARIKKNQVARYHYLPQWSAFQVAEVVLDFKHYFTFPTEDLLKEYCNIEHHRAKLNPPYREHLSQRFSSFLSRIGLPIDLHFIEEDTVDETNKTTA